MILNTQKTNPWREKQSTVCDRHCPKEHSITNQWVTWKKIRICVWESIFKPFFHNAGHKGCGKFSLLFASQSEAPFLPSAPRSSSKNIVLITASWSIITSSKKNIIRTDILKYTIIIFKDLIICSRMKCSVNLATSNSAEVRKWSDSFSFLCFKNTIYLLLCLLKERESVSVMNWIKCLTQHYEHQGQLFSVFLHISSLSVPLQQHKNKQLSGVQSTLQSLSSQPQSALLSHSLSCISFLPWKHLESHFPFTSLLSKELFFEGFQSTLLSSISHVLTSIWLCLGITYKLIFKQFPYYCMTTHLSVPLGWFCQQVTGSILFEFLLLYMSM